MLYFVCLRCNDKFIMDEDYVEIPDPDGQQGETKHAGLDYDGGDCLCPICGQFTGRLVGQR